MQFPESKEAFKELLADGKLAAKYPDHWAGDWAEFSETNVMKYLFLQGIWAFMENPLKSSYTAEKVARSRAWARGYRGRRVAKHIPIVEKMLDAGISPEEMSSLVLYSQINLVFQILYMLDDNAVCIPLDLEQRGFGLFETKGGVPFGDDWRLNDDFSSTRPPEFPGHDWDN